MKLKLIWPVVLLVMFIGLTSCTARVSTSYSPSILLDGKGQVNIENFTFLPEGYSFVSNENIYKKVTNESQYLEINQIQIEPGIGTILLDKSVSDFITDAVKKEFKYIGYKNNIEAPVVLTGVIRRLSIKKGFTSSDFITKIDFKLVNKDNKREFSKLSEGKFTMSEMHTKEPTTALYTSISKAIEDFIRSAQDNGII